MAEPSGNSYGNSSVNPKGKVYLGLIKLPFLFCPRLSFPFLPRIILLI